MKVTGLTVSFNKRGEVRDLSVATDDQKTNEYLQKADIEGKISTLKKLKQEVTSIKEPKTNEAPNKKDIFYRVDVSPEGALSTWVIRALDEDPRCPEGFIPTTHVLLKLEDLPDPAKVVVNELIHITFTKGGDE